MAGSMKQRVIGLMVALALCVPGALMAQQKDKDPRVNPPIMPAGESTSRAPEGAMAPGAPAPAPASRPDQTPLTGAEILSLGTFDGGRTYLLPSFSVTTGSEWHAGDYQFRGNVRGGITLHRDTGYSKMSLAYTTGAIFGGLQSSNFQSQAHSLAFTQNLQFRRWSLMIADSFSYLPESSFGFDTFSGIGRPNIGAVPNWNVGFGGQQNLDPTFIPDQTIHTGDARRYSNTIIGQATVQLSPRWSLTGAGSFGILRFVDEGFVESDNSAVRVGLNYMLNARDTLGFSYSSNMIRFSTDADINSHMLQFLYGRRITGRLALRVGAGPSFLRSDDPLAGKERRASWNASSFLTYSLGQSTYGFGYTYQTTNGSGVQVGAQTHALHFMGARQISRLWTLSGNAGYAHNSGLLALNSGNLHRSFNTWFAGADLGRPLGRYSRLSFRYQVTRQTVSCPPTALSCVGQGLRHQFGVNIDFSRQFNPIELN